MNFGDRLHSQIHYYVRKHLSVDPQSLPPTDESDARVAQYVLDFQMGLNKDPRVPVPASQYAYVYLAALQKSKRPEYFARGPQKTIVPYVFRSEVFAQRSLPSPGQYQALKELVQPPPAAHSSVSKVSYGSRPKKITE